MAQFQGQLGKLEAWLQKKQLKDPNFDVQGAIQRHAKDPKFQQFDFNKLASLGFGKLPDAVAMKTPVKQGYPQGIGGITPDPQKWHKGTATSFWDTGHSGMGDTGRPASGAEMQFNMVASPYLPMGTQLEIQGAGGRKVQAFVGDKGPGAGGDLLDLSAPMAAYLYGRSVKSARSGTKDPVQYRVTGWGTGSTLYGGSSQAQKFKSLYGGLKKTPAPPKRVKWNMHGQIPDEFFNWRG